jgi:uncharacterized membrane protein
MKYYKQSFFVGLLFLIFPILEILDLAHPIDLLMHSVLTVLAAVPAGMFFALSWLFLNERVGE